MRKQLQRTAIAGIVLAVVLPMGGGASAVPADATLRVEKQGWYWRQAEQTRVEAEPPVCPDPSTGAPCPNVTQQPSPIEQDHFAVGYASSRPQDERIQAIPMFQFDLSWMSPDTKVTKGTLFLEESQDDATHRGRMPSGTVNAAAAGTKLRVCIVTDFWGPSQPGRWEELPPVDCAKASGEGKREIVDADGRPTPVWRFDLTAIAKAWGKDPLSNAGVAIMPAADASGEFQVSFHGDTRIITQDPVTRIEEVEELIRVRATMKFDAPAESLAGNDDADGGPGGGSTVAVSPLFGSSLPAFGGNGLGAASPLGAGASLDVSTPDVNRSVDVEPAPVRAFAPQVQTPAYVWIGLPLALLLARLFGLLFIDGGPRVRPHRVAAVRARQISSTTTT